MSRAWTEEDLNFLTDNYGSFSLKHLCKELNRSESAIQNKVNRLNLGRWYQNIEMITLNQLRFALNVEYSTVVRWEKNYNLPTKEKRFKKTKFKFVLIDSFWKWAEKNKNVVEWDKVEKHILGAEPEWVAEARSSAFKTSVSVSKSYKKKVWSKDEDEKLKHLVKQQKYTYSQIAEKIGRTQGAIKRRLFALEIKERPIYLDNHKKYSEQEIEIAIKMLLEGNSFHVIDNKLNRSELGIRGKIERMGYTFKHGVPVKK